MTVTEFADLRADVRALIDEWQRDGRIVARADAWVRGYDPQFSQALAERGWIGITWPEEFGGQARSNSARLVLTEELLTAGAPVAGHWLGERQIGPAILRYGTPFLQQKYLPEISRGAVTFCLGMSETESGSDLASVRTSATAVEGGWRVNGRKIWTSQAHNATHAYLLARSDRQADKHDGLSELIVDMSSAGVEVRPIYDLRGEHHFNEITFDDVFVPADHLLGELGNGWTQVTEQLAFERGGMERLLSTYPLLLASVAAAREPDELGRTGAALAQLATMRQLAVHIAAEMDAGAAPMLLAAVLKDVGTLFEGDVNELARSILDVEPDPSATGPAQLLGDAIMAAPGFTIRGGVTEILRTIISRGVAKDGQVGRLLPDAGDGELRSVADDVLGGRGGEPADPGDPTAMWGTIVDLGWPSVGVAESAGGVGGEFADLVTLVRACGRHAVSVPLLESAWSALLTAANGHPLPDLPATVVVARRSEQLRIDDGGELTISGTATRVPWGAAAATLVVSALDAQGAAVLVEVTGPAGAGGPQPGLTVEAGLNLAGEPRDTLVFDHAQARLIGTPATDVLELGALLRAAQTLGALETALEHTVRHVSVREQFGRPLLRFQTVGSTLAQMAEQVTLAAIAVQGAAADPRRRDAGAIAAVVTARAATVVARAAHQLHGAIGVTREHPLHLVTRRLWSWRDEFGGERFWSRRIGERIAPLEPHALWDWVAGID
jgi:alkylation response protein AidB-like acyl-CoA dehydrogenase